MDERVRLFVLSSCFLSNLYLCSGFPHVLMVSVSYSDLRVPCKIKYLYFPTSGIRWLLGRSQTMKHGYNVTAHGPLTVLALQQSAATFHSCCSLSESRLPRIDCQVRRQWQCSES